MGQVGTPSFLCQLMGQVGTLHYFQMEIICHLISLTFASKSILKSNTDVKGNILMSKSCRLGIYNLNSVIILTLTQ